MIKPIINPESSLFRSEFQADQLTDSRHQNPLLQLLFISALGMTLFDGSWLWLARAGWTLLAILIASQMRFGFYSLFFFAAFFHPTGFIPNPIFTLKHFQIAFLINLTVHALSGNPVKTFIAGLKRAGSFYLPWAIILMLGLFNFVRFPASEQAWMTPLNLTSIMAAMIYMLGRCEQILLRHPAEKTVRNCLSFFVAGVIVQVFIAFQNTISETLYFNMPLFHNNHIGILCAFSAFFPIALFFSETNPLKKKIWAAATFILISATVASCSRTAWFSFVAAFTVFFVLARKFQPNTHFSAMRKRHSATVLLFVLTAAIILSRGYEIVFYRFIGLIKLFDWKYWEYTFTDYQNFGFLGIFRLQQIYMIKDILQSQPFLGIGFIKDVMDFHGFYFTLLGGTGVVGFAVFVYFCRKTLHASLARISDSGRISDNFFLLLSAFCAFIAWLLCCFMETYVVQFSVWIIFWVLSALLHPLLPSSVSKNENP